MEFFKDAGYTVAGSGKLMHFHRRSDWSEFANKADYGPFAFDGKDRVAHSDVPMLTMTSVLLMDHMGRSKIFHSRDRISLVVVG